MPSTPFGGVLFYNSIVSYLSTYRKDLKEMKRTLALLTGIILASMAFTACGGTDNTSASGNSTAETTAAAESAAAEETTTTAAAESAAETEKAEEPAETEKPAEESAANAETKDEGKAEGEDEEEDYTTGDASLDNIRNQDEIGDNELLVLSFGTSYNDSRRLTIGAIEDSLEKAFPDYSVRRGFTANIIIDHVNRRDGILIDDVDAALKRAEDNGVKNLVVQPTHLMNGLEYHDLIEQVGSHADAFDKVAFGEPLLTSDEDFKRVEDAIVEWTKEYDDGKTAICFMGHGTEAESNAVYQKIQDLLTADGHTNYFVGTVEASPSVDDVLELVKKGDYERVVLEPLMVVAGDHANNDMAGDEEDSWKSVFEAAGYKVECLLRGLGENEKIREIYADHAKAAIESIK